MKQKLIFLKFPWFFYDPKNVGNLISGSTAFSKHSFVHLEVLGSSGKESCTGKESACQCRKPRRCRFSPWMGKISRSREWQSTPVFLPRKSHREAWGGGWLQSMGSQRVGHNRATEHTFLSVVHEHLSLKLMRNLHVILTISSLPLPSRQRWQNAACQVLGANVKGENQRERWNCFSLGWGLPGGKPTERTVRRTK